MQALPLLHSALLKNQRKKNPFGFANRGIYFQCQQPKSMKKRTLQFTGLNELTQFTQRLTNGYIINTVTMTVTALMSDFQFQLAMDMYAAEAVDLTRKLRVEEDLFA